MSEPPPPPSEGGPSPQGIRMQGMADAVREDIAAMGELHSKAAKSLTKLALWLAESVDARGHDMSPANVARVAQELRATLIALTTERANDGDRLDEFFARMSSPVRDGEDSRPPDDGSASR